MSRSVWRIEEVWRGVQLYPTEEPGREVIEINLQPIKQTCVRTGFISQPSVAEASALMSMLAMRGPSTRRVTRAERIDLKSPTNRAIHLPVSTK